MSDITERLDPDRWIADGKALANYPILEPFSPHMSLVDVVFADKRELAGHLVSWMARVAEGRLAQAINRQDIVGGTLTEESLRSLWEETRPGRESRSAYEVQKGTTLSAPEEIVPEDVIPLAIAEALARRARL
jgi:hypothetical protein